MAFQVRNAKKLQGKSRKHEVAETGPHTYTVTSGTSGNVYRVWLGEGNRAECTCEWGNYRRSGSGSGCSHVIAVHEYIAEQNGRRVSAWGSEDDAKRQKRAMYGIGDGVILTTRTA